jgi:hypothetical protein
MLYLDSGYAEEGGGTNSAPGDALLEMIKYGFASTGRRAIEPVDVWNSPTRSLEHVRLRFPCVGDRPDRSGESLFAMFRRLVRTCRHHAKGEKRQDAETQQN